MSADCSTGRHGYAMGYTLTASLAVVSIFYLASKLMYGYRLKDKLKRPPAWLFYSGLIFVFISIIILIKCTFYGLSYCNYIHIDQEAQKIIFDIIFGDLYVIQLYFLWIVLFIRLYYTLSNTPYALSQLTIRIYSIIFICSPILTILISIKSLYTIFIVLGLSGGIFITLSIIILYIFKLIQVYTRYSDNYQQFEEDNEVNLKNTITKNTILIIICTLFSLLILFVLIMNFIFSVYHISYGYQQQFADICLLLDVYITAICILFQFQFANPNYLYFCGCIDVVCRYYCNQFVNPTLQTPSPQPPPVAAEKQSKPRVSIELRPPAPSSKSANKHLNVPIHGNPHARDLILSDSELNSPSEHINISVNVNHTKNNEQSSASYELGQLQKPDFQDLPSLPMDNNDSMNNIKGSHRAFLADSNNMKFAMNMQQYKKQELHDLVSKDSSYGDVDIITVLLRYGFSREFIGRALIVYEKHYDASNVELYDITIIREIIYRLEIKDKLKELKRVQNLFQSRDAVEGILMSLNFSADYINTALTMYEVMAEMFEINKHHENIYDLELVTEMIMRLRAKDRERGLLIEDDVIRQEMKEMQELKKEKNVQKKQKAQQQQKPKENMIVVTNHNANEMELNPSELSMDASAPSSHAGEIQMHHNKINKRPVIVIHNDMNESLSQRNQNSQIHQIHQSSRKKQKRGGDNSPSDLLDVIADNHGQKSDFTDSELIEITVNTNDMDMDGENSPSFSSSQEEEHEQGQQAPPVYAGDAKHKNAKKTKKHSNSSKSESSSQQQQHHAFQRSGIPDTGQYVNNIIAYNNAELRAAHHMDSKGNLNDIINRNANPQRMQLYYEEYILEYGFEPTEPKYLVYFVKEKKGENISFTDAMNVISTNYTLQPPPIHPAISQMGLNAKSTDKESMASTNRTPLPQSTINDTGTYDDSLDDSDDSRAQNVYANANIANNMAQAHSMDDDMDDDTLITIDNDELIEMDSDEQDTDTEEEEIDTDDSDLIDIEEAEAEHLYDDYLPGIPQIKPGDVPQNMMPIVPDNVSQNYDYADYQKQVIDNEEEESSQSTHSSDTEYDEEYYDEDQQYEEYEDEKESTQSEELSPKQRHIHQYIPSNHTNNTASYTDDTGNHHLNNNSNDLALDILSPRTGNSTGTMGTMVTADIEHDYLPKMGSNNMYHKFSASHTNSKLNNNYNAYEIETQNTYSVNSE